MKQDSVHGDLEILVLKDIITTYPYSEYKDWYERVHMFWKDKLDDTGYSQRCGLEGRRNFETGLPVLWWLQDIHDY